MLRLLAGAVGEPDDREAGDAAVEVGLDLDAAGVEADERMRDGPREHLTRLGSPPIHVCAENEPKTNVADRRRAGHPRGYYGPSGLDTEPGQDDRQERGPSRGGRRLVRVVADAGAEDEPLRPLRA